MRKNLFKLNKKIYIKIALIMCLIFAFLFTASLFTIKYLISDSFIEKKISKITNLKIELTKPETNLDYKLNLNAKAEKIEIFNENKNIKFITLINPEITLKPISLLFKRINFKKINADNIHIKIARNSDGKIDLFDSINKDMNNFFDKKTSISRLNINIKNTNISFKDNYKIKSETNFNLKETKLNIHKRKKILTFKQKGTIQTSLNNKTQKANLDLNINSKFPIINPEDLNLNIKLDNINLYIFNDIIKKHISKDILSLDGGAKLSINSEDKKQKINLEIHNPTFKLIDGKTLSPYKNNVKLNSNLEIKKNKIEILDAKITGENLHVISQGKIENPLSNNPSINLNTDIQNTQINNLIPFIPDNAIFYNPKGIPALKKSNFHGIVNGRINLKLFPLNIDGNLKVENVHIPGIPKSYKQNDVNAIFMKDKVRIYTRVYTPDNEYVSVDGISNLDDSLYGKYSIKSTSKVNLSYAQKYLVPIQQIIGFNLGPVPIMNISGWGNIDINTQGTLSDAQIFGTFRAYGASASIKGLDAKLANGNCTLIFDNQEIFFQEIKGKLDDADFSLNGKTNIKGQVELNTKINNAKTNKILKILNNSIISQPYVKLTKNIVDSSGKIEANINITGMIKDFEDSNFFKSLSPSGTITLSNNKITLNNDFNLNNLSGLLHFGKEQSGRFNFNIGNSQFNTEFNSKTPLDKISKGEKFHINTQIFSNKISSNDIILNLGKIAPINSKLNDTNFYAKLSLKSQGELSLNKINLTNFKHNGYIIGLNSTENKNVNFDSGIIRFNGDKTIFDNMDIRYKEGRVKAKGSIHNLLSAKPLGNLIVDFNNIELDNLDKIIPKIKMQKAVIKNGQLILKNDNLKIDSISINLNDTPLFVNTNIKNIYNTKVFNADFSTILNEQTSDNIINPYLVSPLKITGEIPIKGTFAGNNNNYNIDFSAKIPKNSDISYGGANLGDLNHRRELQGSISVSENIAKIDNLKLIKYIANQNNKINPITALKIDGLIRQNNDIIAYDNLKISTNSPINVRILNLIFKKSLLKKGNFDCNISLNGDIKLPKINGKVNLYDLDIPLYDTKIDNIKLNISNKFIDGEILVKNKQSDAKLKIHALNKLDTPYIIKDFILTSNKLNINNLLNSYNPTASKTDIQLKNELPIKPTDITFEKGSFDFKEVYYNKISTKDLIGSLSYKDGVINIESLLLTIAEGMINADGKYDIKTGKLNLNAQMKGCDSNILTKDFLNLPNQIFGKMDGTISLSGKNLHTPEGINSIKSDIDFSIDNGKMPKLGSLEYLLRAGNLFKNGLLGLSLNNLIEVLTPYKTGEFEKISGNLSINKGEIEKLNILSKGKNLSLFLDGNYSIFENFADIQIYGKLSQNISNALGAVGNASINQLVEAIAQAKRNKHGKDKELQQNLNKIPSIENEASTPRYFRAKVLGDINKDNYIKNFDWL